MSPDFEDGNLKFASADADRFEDFLREKLEVPEDNIINLRDEQATRAAILQGFYTLRDDTRIIKDNAAIIIYFAGHGASSTKPVEWADWVTASGMIEELLPSDIGVRSGSEVEPICGIPDRTISVLLNQIADCKGNNITLILDCCHSGGLNRTERDGILAQGYVPRRILHPPPIRASCDENTVSLGTKRGGGVAVGYFGRHNASHVLLAACGRMQLAYEHPREKGGLFTTQLLRALLACNVDDLTYSALMHRLQMPEWQTPHYEGRHVHRRLFNKHALGADNSFILGRREVNKEDKIGSYLLYAGAAQGITEGSIFGVHASNLASDARHSNPQLGTFGVSKVGAFKSELMSLPDTPVLKAGQLFYCRLVQRKAVPFKIFCDNKAWLESVFTSEFCAASSISFADIPSESSLQFSLVDGMVHLSRNNPLVNPWIGSKMAHTIHMSEVHKLQNIALCTLHFDYQLIRPGINNFKDVSMELRELQLRHVENQQILIPHGPNLIENEPAVIVVDEEAELGLTIHNHTDHRLYPYLFYFDPTDLVIVEWYSAPFGAGLGRLTHQVDAPLPPHGSLSIGYGDGGCPPWQFVLRDGEDMDIGFFKLFLTTAPASFSSVRQDSPFDQLSLRSGIPIVPQAPTAESWGTILSTVIQVRHEEQLIVEPRVLAERSVEP